MRRPTLTALLGLTLLTASAALAGGPKLAVAPRFGAALVPGYEQPLTVTLTNPSEGEAFTGEVTVTQRGQSWTAPVTLAAGAGVATVNLRIRYRKDDWDALDVSLRNQQGRLLATKTWNPPLKPGFLVRVLVLSPDGTAPYWDAVQGEPTTLQRYRGQLSETVLRPRDVRTPHYSIVGATPHQLTEHIYELNQFAIVALAEGTTLSPEQRTTLDLWVSRGGALVLHENGPTRVESRGAGRIVHTKALPDVKNLVTPRSYVRFLEIYPEIEAELFPGMLSTLGVKAPPFSTIAIFLGIYLLAVVPLQYLILRRLDKREWAWGTTPLLAGAFALAAYVVGSQGRSREAFYSTAAVIETGAGQSTGSAIARFVLYSPERASYNLSAPTVDTAFFRTRSEGAMLHTEQVPQKPTRLRDFAVSQWALQSVGLQTQELPLGGGVQAELKRRGDFLEGTITNKTGVLLERVQVSCGLGRAFVDRLAPGESRSVQLSVRSEETLLQGINTESMSKYANQHTEPGQFFSLLADSLPSEPSQGEWVPRTNEALITAFTSQELVPVRIEGGKVAPKVTDSLLIVHVPIAAP